MVLATLKQECFHFFYEVYNTQTEETLITLSEVFGGEVVEPC